MYWLINVNIPQELETVGSRLQVREKAWERSLCNTK